MARRTSKIHADAFYTFVMIFGEWKAFLGLMAVMIVMAFLVVGLPEEFDGAMGVLFTLIFVMGWLATIYMLRQKLAGEEVRLRDGLFKSMAPLIPTLIMLMVVVLECVPVMATVVVWSSAVETHFLDMPFNALMLIVFTVAMVLLSGFLLTSSLLALVAVGTPGIYPVTAILTVRELVAKKRIKVAVRIILLLIVVVAMGALVVPFMLLPSSTFLKVASLVVGSFATIYVATYLYLYYKELLG